MDVVPALAAVKEDSHITRKDGSDLRLVLPLPITMNELLYHYFVSWFLSWAASFALIPFFSHFTLVREVVFGSFFFFLGSQLGLFFLAFVHPEVTLSL